MKNVETITILTMIVPLAIKLISIFLVIFFVVRLESINTYIRDIRNELRKMNDKK